MFIHFKLLRKSFKSQLPNLFVSPEFIHAMISTGLVCDDVIKEALISYFARTIPSFYIPEHVSTPDGFELEDNSVYMIYHAKMSDQFIELTRNVLSKITNLYGITCSVDVQPGYPDVKYNWTGYETGIEVNGVGGQKLFYKRKSEIPKAVVSFNQPQRITMKLIPSFDYNNSLKILNSFHKLLITHLPFNHQTLGSFRGEFLSADESLFFEAGNVVDGMFDEIIIKCPTGISDALVELLHSGLEAEFFGNKQKFSIQFSNDEYFIEEPHTSFQTTTPAFFPGKYSSSENSKPINRPEGCFLVNLMYQNGIEFDPSIDITIDDDGFFCADLPLYGHTSIKATPIESEFNPVRGGRRGLISTPFKVEIHFDKPSIVRSIGLHSRFGCGVFSPVLS